MSRKNSELEGTLRKARSQARKLESERDRLASRFASLEASLAAEQERAMHATQAAALQVFSLTGHCALLNSLMILLYSCPQHTI